MFRPICHDAERFLYLIPCFNGRLQRFLNRSLSLLYAHRAGLATPSLSLYHRLLAIFVRLHSIEVFAQVKRATLGPRYSTLASSTNCN